MLPLPEHERDRMSQWVADGIADIDRKSTALHSLDVTIGEGAAPFLRINNGGPRNAFFLEMNRNRIMYRHEAEGTEGTANPLLHIKQVAVPLLRRLAENQQISGRFLTLGSAYELTSVVAGPGNPNCELAITKLVAGLGQRPWERGLDRVTHPLGCLDLKWAVNNKICDKAALMWFKLECTANDDHSQINTTIVLQSSPGELPSPSWAATADAIHIAAWPTVLEFMTWLFAKTGVTHEASERSAATLGSAQRGR